MNDLARHKLYPALALGGAVVLGLLEFVALRRSAWLQRDAEASNG